ncbi:SDR family NAD(P)-dependent oxidoreductase [Kitasatospora sp. NBC_01302]|uniref:SDR family NAD(P)-dependent oxidoreductase n=1 Tax=Kitasatospora sp. NBC_01302 TaxID=2903575 RepID=UPI002E0E416D|nr:SDR family NAD(P)-dependent oxidoreductase [Kitasatospora sp. NBC_01302]
MPHTPTTILITGATDGLGRELALRLAGPGTLLVLHGRSAERAAEVQRQVRAAGGEAEVRLADLGDLRQVDRLADTVLADFDRLDVLVNNAGIGFGTPDSGRQESADGIELRLAVNYLAGYRLTGRLLPRLTEAAAPGKAARIVNVASAGQHPIDFADPQLTSHYDGVVAYRRSKLAQIIATFDLAERLAEADVPVTVNALHPASFMATTMVQEAAVTPLSTVAQGVEATLQLVTGSAGARTGRYFNGLQPATADQQAYDPDARTRLRSLSDELIAHALS